MQIEAEKEDNNQIKKQAYNFFATNLTANLRKLSRNKRTLTFVMTSDTFGTFSSILCAIGKKGKEVKLDAGSLHRIISNNEYMFVFSQKD